MLYNSGTFEKMVNPKEWYGRDLLRSNFDSDPRQAAAVEKLDTLYSHLENDSKSP